jgi:hypothetical protein
MLGINYSTAKTILRIFRLEKRVEKKNAEQERQLKSFLKSYKKTQNESCEELSSRSSLIDSQISQTNAGSEESNCIGKEFKEFKELKEFEQLNKSLGELYSNINNCFENIKVNQNLIGILFNTIQGAGANRQYPQYPHTFYSM